MRKKGKNYKKKSNYKFANHFITNKNYLLSDIKLVTLFGSFRKKNGEKYKEK